jgi:PAS domain S-box-containing protein
MRRLELPLGVGMFGRAVDERRVIVTGDYFEDTAFVHYETADRFSKAAGLRSMVVAPMIAGERVFGALGTYSHQRDAFGEPEVGLVRSLADHAAAAMSNALLIEELDRSRHELARRADVERALRDLGARISALREPEDVLQLAVDEAARLLDADGARIDRLDEVSGTLHWAYDATTGKRPGLGRIKGRGEARAGEGISGRAVNEGTAVWTGDYLADERFDHATAPDRHVRRHGIRSAVAAPLLGDRGPLGTLTVYTHEVDAYREPEARLVEVIAGQAAIAMTNARLIDELARNRESEARRADAERSLREIAARITAIRDPGDLLQHVVEEAARLLGAERSRIDLLGWEGRPGSTHLVGSGDTPGASAIAAGGQPVDRGLAGLATRRGEIVVTGNYLTDKRFEHDPAADDAARRDGIHSVVAAPLYGEGELLGVLQVGSPRLDAFGEDDLALAQALAHQASVAITNARLIEQIARSNREIARRAESDRALREIGARLTAIRDPGELLRDLSAEAARLLGSRAGVIDILDREGRFSSGFEAGSEPGMREEWRRRGMADPASDLAMKLRAPIVSADYATDPRFDAAEHTEFIHRVGLRSLAVAPLIGESGGLGTLAVFTDQVGAYDEEDAALLATLADQATIAIQNSRLVEDLDRSRAENARRAEVEQAVREIAAQISALRDPNAVLQRTVDEARRLLDSDASRIDLLDGQILRWTFESGDAEIMNARPHEALDELPVGIGVAGAAILRRRAIWTGDYLADPSFEHQAAGDEFAARTGIRSGMSAPLIGETGPLGALTVNARRPDAYDERQAAVLQALADQAAIAIQNTRLIEELQRSRVELAARADAERSLREMAARIAALRDPFELLEGVVDETRRLLRSDGAHLTRMSEDRSFVYPVIVAGAADSATRDWLVTQEFPIDGGINGLAAGTGQPVWTEDYRSDPRIPREPDDLDVAARLGLRAMAAVPLRASAGEIIGTLAVSYDHPRAFETDEIELLQGLADHAAIAITNSTLYGRLRESEERYRHLVQNSPDLVWDIDADARLTFVSDTCERLTGWRPEELLGQHFGALVHESSSDVATLDWTAGMSQPSQELRGRLNLLHRDGHPIPAEFIALGRLDAEGRFAGANGSVRDMTERDRLERELRESESRYRFLVENSPDVIFSTDAEGTFTYLSESMERMTGYRPDELVGKHFSMVVAEHSMSEAGTRWAALVANPAEDQQAFLELRTKDGRFVPVEVSSKGDQVDGRFAGIHGATRDITERARLERELRESEERYRYLVQSSPDLVWVTDADGRWTFISDTAEKILGWKPEELIGRHFSELAPREERRGTIGRWRWLARHPTRVHRARLPMLTRDGHVIQTEITGLGMVEDGRFVGAHGAARDVSDRERLELELRLHADELARRVEAQRTLAEMAAQIAALRDPTAVIQRTVDEAVRLLGADHALLNPLDVEAGVLQLALAQSPSDRGLDDVLVPVGAGISGRAISERRVVWTGDYLEDRSFDHAPEIDDFTAAREVASVMSAPLVGTDGPIGTLSVQSKRPHAFGEDDAELLGLLADQAAIAIVNSRLYAQLRDSEERWRYLAKASPDVVWAVDDHGVITFMSDRIEPLTGFRPDELIGRLFDVLGDLPSRPAATAVWESVRRDPTGVYPLTLHLPRRHGEPVPVEIWVTGSLRDGKFSGAHGSIRDMRERETFERDLRRQAAELAASDERAHLARELHDSVTQALFSMTLLSRTIEMLIDRDPAAAREQLGSLRELQREALAEMRALIFELRPGNLEQDGLIHALRTHTAALQGRIGLPVVVTSEVGERLPIELEEVLYRIAQEALHNIVKHAAARQVRLDLAPVGDGIRLRIEDDGRGFDPAAVPDGHLGIAGMRARAEKIGISLTVRSTPGKGTTVDIVVPQRAIDERAPGGQRVAVTSAE